MAPRIIGFITSPAVGGISEDDAFAARALEQRGVEVVPVDWRSALQRPVDALVMRSPWDWYHHRAEFRAFLTSLATARVPVFNDPATLLRFADKSYFAELEQRGVTTIPTHFFSRAPSAGELTEALARLRWPRAVLKPTFTANAAGAVRFTPTQAAEVAQAARGSSIDSGWMLQPYVEAIETDGEWALVFFRQQLSHAVRKRPKRGDYRVQHEHGGGAEADVPPPSLREWASAVITAVAPHALYARVDAVWFESAWRVMELELVEPELFFRADPMAAERFADALLALLAAGPGVP